MCYKVSCSKCGKTTWGGCGRHVASVHKQINEGEHCLCRPWPGVQPLGADGVASAAESSSSSSMCVIL
ncbi:hypothetical protein EJ110_NYTH09590 [Nymphaea thermarum]|nr:hypothetical protein EJ110_NYTH09590 [Nymphaea thermarum]